MALTLFHLLVFPGALYLLVASLALNWLDRMLVARWQARVGPPWYQPVADLIKLLAKEDVSPTGTHQTLATLLPLVSIAATFTAGLYVPVGNRAAHSFEGDLIVVTFLLSLPTLAYFLAGWATPSVYGVMGGNRSLLQYFSYEVPLLVGVAAPAVLTRSWTISRMMEAQFGYRWNLFVVPMAFAVALVGLMGKLKRVPFDIPQAKSEVGAGPLTEYSGRKLGLWKLTLAVQTLVGINLMIALFLGGADQAWGHWGFLIYVVKVALLMAGFALAQVLYARLRIDQMATIGWRLLVPIGILQMAATVWMGRI